MPGVLQTAWPAQVSELLYTYGQCVYQAETRLPCTLSNTLKRHVARLRRPPSRPAETGTCIGHQSLRWWNFAISGWPRERAVSPENRKAVKLYAVTGVAAGFRL